MIKVGALKDRGLHQGSSNGFNSMGKKSSSIELCLVLEGSHFIKIKLVNRITDFILSSNY